MNADRFARRCVQRLAPQPVDEVASRWTAWITMLQACRGAIDSHVQDDFSLNWHTRLYDIYRSRPDESLAAEELEKIEAVHAERAIWSVLCAFLDAQGDEDRAEALNRFLELKTKHPDEAGRFIRLYLHSVYPESATPEYLHYCEVFGIKPPR